MTKKIGILTFHHVMNEGAVLQSLSVATILSQLFPDARVEIIDYESKTAEKCYFHETFLRPKNIRLYMEDAKRFFNIKSFIKATLPLTKRRLTSDSYSAAVSFINQQNYDAILVGSDEIWKKGGRFIKRPFPNIYWLSKLIKAKKIAIAASANKLLMNNLNDVEKSWVAERLRDFAYIGVRDNHTVNLVSALAPDCQRKLFKLNDPTFMMEIGEPDKYFYRKLGIRFDKKIAGITFHDPAINKPLIAFLKKAGFQVVAITAFNPDADINLSGRLSPLQWAETFKMFDLCLTNLFHGTIFSIKAACAFVSFDYFSGRGSETKMGCLLSDLDMTEHHLPQESFISDPSKIHNAIHNVLTSYRKSDYEEAVRTCQASVRFFLNKVKDYIEQ